MSTERLITDFTPQIDNEVKQFEILMNSLVSLQEKIAERATDLIDLASVVNILIKTTEERFHQINEKIIQLIEQSKNNNIDAEKKNIVEVLKEFGDLISDLDAIKNFILLKIKVYKNELAGKTATEDFKDMGTLEMDMGTYDQLVQELAVFPQQETKFKQDIRICFNSIKELKKEINTRDVESGQVYNTIMQEIEKFEPTSQRASKIVQFFKNRKKT